jgi:hypothetical protein
VALIDLWWRRRIGIIAVAIGRIRIIAPSPERKPNPDGDARPTPSPSRVAMPTPSRTTVPAPSSMTTPLRAGRRSESEQHRHCRCTDERSVNFHKTCPFFNGQKHTHNFVVSHKKVLYFSTVHFPSSLPPLAAWSGKPGPPSDPIPKGNCPPPGPIYSRGSSARRAQPSRSPSAR